MRRPIRALLGSATLALGLALIPTGAGAQIQITGNARLTRRDDHHRR